MSLHLYATTGFIASSFRHFLTIIILGSVSLDIPDRASVCMKYERVSQYHIEKLHVCDWLTAPCSMGS